MICREVIVAGTDIQENTSLPCGHTFHTECITRYAECKRCGLAQACPYRCHRSIEDVRDDDEVDIVLPAMQSDVRRGETFLEEMAASVAASTLLE